MFEVKNSLNILWLICLLLIIFVKILIVIFRGLVFLYGLFVVVRVLKILVSINICLGIDKFFVVNWWGYLVFFNVLWCVEV